MKTVSLAAKPVTKISGILLIAVIFFVLYNRFMINQSLEDLRFSLSNIQKNEYSGLDKLLSYVLLSEIAKEPIQTDIFENIEYACDVIGLAKSGRSLADAADILRSVITKKEDERGAFLTAIDTVNNGLSGALGLSPDLKKRISRNKAREKALLEEKKRLYARLISPTSPGETKDIVFKLVSDMPEEEKKRELFNVVSGVSLKDKQEILYRIGIAEMRSSNYDQAIFLLKEAFGVDPKSPIAPKLLFNLAWCEKALHNFKKSEEYLREFIKLFPDDDLKENAALQIALLYRKTSQYNETADSFLAVAHKNEHSPLAPIALFQALATYLYDLGDEGSAKEVFEELNALYPASEYSSAKTFVYKRLFSEETARFDLGYQIYKLLWNMSPLATAISEVTDKISTRFVIRMIEGTIQQIELLNLDLGDTVRIERTDEFLTNWCNRSLDVVSKNALVSVKNVLIRYKESNRIEVSGFVRLGTVELMGYAIGRMELKKDAYITYDAYKSEKQIIYTVEMCKIGRIEIPADIINKALVRAHRIFNQKIPFEIRRFEINMATRTGIWEGPQKESALKLRDEKPETYKYLYIK